MKIVITGAHGFIGKNLMVHLRFKGYTDVVAITRHDDMAAVISKLKGADCVFHLAGVNRPEDPSDFERINFGLTTVIVQTLEEGQQPYRLIYTSSTQAEQNNPYGQSKLKAEEFINAHVKKGFAFIYRLPGVFGKWCRPNYNSVVATFCYNIARDLPVTISDPSKVLHLVYVDDVVKEMISSMELPGNAATVSRPEVTPVHEQTLGGLVEAIRKFRESRATLVLPEIGDAFIKKLYTTWLSYLPDDAFSYGLELKTDNRGWLFELLKTKTAGQIFISKTHPGITRGNHFHHTKTEKFVVIEGEGLIRFRKVEGDDTGNIIEYKVSGSQPQVVDIPPGYTHNITNIGSGEMLTLFWANEIYDPSMPDTYFLNV